MKVYSKSKLALGIGGIALGLFFFTQGSLLYLLFGILWLIIGGDHFCSAFNKDREEKKAEQARKSAETARKRFGRWAVPVRWFGIVPAGLGVVLFAAMPAKTAVWLTTLLLGVLYSLAVELWLKYNE